MGNGGLGNGQRRDLSALCLLAGLLVLGTAAVFPGVFLRGELIGPADVLYEMSPWSELAPTEWRGNPHSLMLDIYAFFSQTYHNVAEAFHRGEWPLWNPYQFCGMPVLANFQSSIFYPPRLLLYFLDLPAAMTLFVILKIWLCGFTAYACGRGLGLPVRGAVFLGLAWAFGGYCIVWANWPLTDVAAWFPVLFLGVEWTLCGRYRRGVAAGACGAAMMLLAGHPETLFAFSLGLGLYFAVRLGAGALRGGPVLGPVLACTALWTIALAVCAAQLAPFLEYLLNSATFFERQYREHLHAYPVRSLAAFFVPKFLGAMRQDNYWGTQNAILDSTLHLAAPVLLLACWAALRGWRLPGPDGCRDRVWSARLIGLFAGATLCLMLAFDFYSLLWVHRLPLFSSTIRAYHAVFPLFALTLAGAYGFSRWTEGRRGWRDLLALSPVVLAGFGLTLGIYLFHAPVLRAEGNAEFVMRQMLLSLGLAAAALAVLALQWRRNPARTAPAAIILVTFAGLLWGQWGMNPTARREDFFPRTELTDHLRAKGLPCRVGISEGGMPSGMFNIYNIQEPLGYDGIYPARFWRVTHALKTDVWDVFEPAMSVQYYLNDRRYPLLIPEEAFARLERETRIGDIEVMRNPRALPHARLVGAAEVIPPAEAAFERLKAPSFSPADTVILEWAPAGGAPAPSLEIPGTVTITDYGCNHVRLEADARAEAMLVLADAYFPGWEARVNGERAEVIPAYHCFRAVKVPAGKSGVVFEYRPKSLRFGLAVSAAALLLCGAWALRELRRRRRATP